MNFCSLCLLYYVFFFDIAQFNLYITVNMSTQSSFFLQRNECSKDQNSLKQLFTGAIDTLLISVEAATS